MAVRQRAGIVPMRDTDAWVTGDNAALLTDLYELTMAQAYFDQGMAEEAVFSLFVRRLPETRNYLLACGLETVLDLLERMHFTDDAIAYLRDRGLFGEDFLDRLRSFRFSGDVYAVPEGTPLFENAPILEIAAPITDGQIVETFVMNQIALQTVLASKAARVVQAAAGRTVIDFGARRMHGVDATSNVLAGRMFGVPIAGTMAHSFVESFDREADAFRAFMATYPETVLLIDTYDTLAGVRRVVEIAKAAGPDFKVRAVRLDSGDLIDLSRHCREILDEADLHQVGIFASGDLDEHVVARIVAAGAPSTDSAWEPPWAFPKTRRAWTSPTSFAPTPVRAASNYRPANRSCRAANRFFVWKTAAGPRPTRLPATARTSRAGRCCSR